MQWGPTDPWTRTGSLDASCVTVASNMLSAAVPCLTDHSRDLRHRAVTYAAAVITRYSPGATHLSTMEGERQTGAPLRMSACHPNFMLSRREPCLETWNATATQTKEIEDAAPTKPCGPKKLGFLGSPADPCTQGARGITEKLVSFATNPKGQVNGRNTSHHAME